MSNKLKKIKKKSLCQITLTGEELFDILTALKRGIWEFDPNQDPGETQFSYCIDCGVVEYNPHKATCKAQELLDLLEKRVRIVGDL